MRLKRRKEKIKINNMKDMAVKYSSVLTPDEKPMNNDVTPILYLELRKMSEEKEMIIIQVIGEVASSKSTVAMALCEFILSTMKKKMGLKYILGDQLDLIEKVIEKGEHDACFVVDEYSTMAETGMGATTDVALLDHYSDIFAQKFAYRIGCSPERITDKNANIVLEVIGKDTKKKITRVLVSYRLIKGYMPTFQIIGHADIYVGDVLKTEWYKKYREMKFERMELLAKEGIRTSREFKFADLTLEVISKMRRLAYLGTASKESIVNYLEIAKVRNKKFLSMIGDKNLIDRIAGVLISEKIIGEIDRRNITLRGRLEKTKDKELKKMIEDRIQEEQESKKVHQEAIEEVIGHYKHLMEIKKKFEAIGQDADGRTKA